MNGGGDLLKKGKKDILKNNMANKIFTISPKEVSITGVKILERKIFYDERGFLIETFSRSKEDESVYSYISFTRPGFARDVDKFHFHHFQKDRFTVVFGKMWVLLYDAREKSPTFGKLEVVEMSGGDPRINQKEEFSVYTLTIPEGVYHGIKNPGQDLAALINHPTAEYNPADEGRILFSEVPIPSLNGECFSWDNVFAK
jgi:dTDP-4-dehydrorhamnose 3,5-epimerase